MNRFLFDPGFQEIGVRISENSTRVQVRHDCQNTNTLFPQVMFPGDLDVFAHFFPTKIDSQNKVQTSVNHNRKKDYV